MPVTLLDNLIYVVILAFIGSGALLAGLVMAVFSALLSFWAGSTDNSVMIQVGRRAFYATAAMIFVASALLETALVTHDFSLAYVTEHTDLSTPIALVAAGFYGGQEGSLLYWALILGILGSASLLASARLGPRLAAYAAGIMAAIASFFLVVLVLVASPFDVLAITPPRAGGLGPAEYGPTPRHVVGVPRAGMGWLLGLGPRRERRLHAVAGDNCIPALVAGAGAARTAAGLELRPGHPRVPAGRVRHLHRAQRDRPFGAHVRGERDRAVVPGLSGCVSRLLDRSSR